MLVISKGRILLDGTPLEIFLNHQEELVSVGMDVPQLFKLGNCLREHGLPIKNDTLNIEDLKEQILVAKGLK